MAGESAGTERSPLKGGARRYPIVAVVNAAVPAFGGSLRLERSDRAWVVAEGIGKAGVVHLKELPQMVLPMRPIT
jgi:hypothetical protein